MQFLLLHHILFTDVKDLIVYKSLFPPGFHCKPKSGERNFWIAPTKLSRLFKITHITYNKQVGNALFMRTIKGATKGLIIMTFTAFSQFWRNILLELEIYCKTYFVLCTQFCKCSYFLSISTNFIHIHPFLPILPNLINFYRFSQTFSYFYPFHPGWHSHYQKTSQLRPLEIS